MGYMTYWIKFLLQQKELRRQMEEYLKWRALRYPTTTQSHKEHLYQFAIQSGRIDVHHIEAEDAAEYVKGANGEYLRGERAKVIYGFLAYHGIGDLATFQQTAMLPVMKKTGRPPDIKHIKLVKKLKNVDRLSFRRIQQEILKKEKHLHQVSQLHAWYHYNLSPVQEKEEK